MMVVRRFSVSCQNATAASRHIFEANPRQGVAIQSVDLGHD